MAADAVLAVITEPLRRLVLGIDSVVLDIWGCEETSSRIHPLAISAVNLLLSVVIFLTLSCSINIRVLLFCGPRAGTA